jgi:transposase
VSFAGERLEVMAALNPTIINQSTTLLPMHRLPSTPLPAALAACLGIDVSKAHLDVCLLTELATRHRARRRAPNTTAGIAQLIQWLEAHISGSISVVMESTGSYGMLAAELFNQAGHRVSIVNAKRVKDFADSQGRRNKTDKADAEVIARFGLTQQLAQWRPLPAQQSVLRDLLRHMADFQSVAQAQANRLEKLRDPQSAVAGSLRRSITWHGGEIKRIEAEVDAHLKAHPSLEADCQRLESIPGIARKTARVLVAEVLRELNSSRAAAAWAGLTPRLNESGTRRKPSKIGPDGNHLLRKALYFPALSAMRHSPRFKTFAQRLAERGKSKMEVIIAVAHKLLRTAFAILKNQSTYDPTHQSIPSRTSPHPA